MRSCPTSSRPLEHGGYARIQRTAELRLWEIELRVSFDRKAASSFAREPNWSFMSSTSSPGRESAFSHRKSMAGQHADSEEDRIRDRWLTEHNYRVMRFLESRQC